MRSFFPTGVATAAVIALAWAAPTPTPAREIELLQYGMRHSFTIACVDDQTSLTTNIDKQLQHAIISLPCASCEAAQADLVCSSATYAFAKSRDPARFPVIVFSHLVLLSCSAP
jgi:hypothetical protein